MTVNARLISLALVAIILVSCAPAPQQQIEIVQAEQKSITVFGEAEVYVAPDVAILDVGIETFNADLIIASDENVEIASEVLQVLSHNNIQESEIHTVNINTSPEVTQGSSSIRRYTVSRRIQIRIRDLKNVDNILSNILMAGANREYAVNFQITDLQKYREEVLILAIEAARAKAEIIADQLGQTLDEPISFQEVSEYQYPGYAPSAFTRKIFDLDDLENSVVPGKISIRAYVLVEFGIK
jgi:uncharacterized protein